MIDVQDRLRAYTGGKPVCMDTVGSACQAGIDEIDRLNAEVARLREALTQIASGGLFQHAHEFARAALAGEEEKP